MIIFRGNVGGWVGGPRDFKEWKNKSRDIHTHYCNSAQFSSHERTVTFSKFNWKNRVLEALLWARNCHDPAQEGNWHQGNILQRSLTAVHKCPAKNLKCLLLKCCHLLVVPNIEIHAVNSCLLKGCHSMGLMQCSRVYAEPSQIDELIKRPFDNAHDILWVYSM